METKEKAAIAIIGTTIAAGIGTVVVYELSKKPPTTPPDTEPPTTPPDTEPPDTEPPLDPTVITFFNVTPKSGLAPLIVGISVNVVDSRSTVKFNFGDGSTPLVKTSGTTHTVNHNYLSAGTYNGSVQVTREDGKKDTKNFTVTVTKEPEPPTGQTFAITSFFQSKNSGTVPFDISISASVNEILTSARIEWGDGQVTELGSNLNADHTYTQEGIFNGKLIAISQDNETAQRSFQVNAGGDTSDPMGEIVVTNKQESVYSFFANFQGSGLTYKWNFGDGTPIQTGPQTIDHAYSKVGDFTVSVEVIDAQGKKGTDTVQVSIRETDLQAELGDATIQKLTNSGSFDYGWKITNVTQRSLSLEYTLRLFNEDGMQLDSRIEKFTLASFASKTINYNLPSLNSGIYNLELEIQDGNTHQLVAFDSQIVTDGSGDPNPPPQTGGSFTVLNYNAFKSGNNVIIAGNGNYENASNQTIQPILKIKVTENSNQYGIVPFLTHTVLPYESVPANSTEPFEYYVTLSNVLSGARYLIEFILFLNNVEVDRFQKIYQN